MNIFVSALLTIVVGGANLAYWWWVARRGEARFRARCERRYGVTITYGPRGHWDVAGPRSRWARFGIGWLQLAYFLGAMVIWACAIIGLLLVYALLE